MGGMIAVSIGGLGVGLVAGGLFFGGLWWTVDRVVGGEYAAPWFAVSTLVRLGFALVAFWGALQWGPVGLVAAMVGFLIARMVATRIVGRPLGESEANETGGHAPWS